MLGKYHTYFGVSPGLSVNQTLIYINTFKFINLSLTIQPCNLMHNRINMITYGCINWFALSLFMILAFYGILIDWFENTNHNWFRKHTIKVI